MTNYQQVLGGFFDGAGADATGADHQTLHFPFEKCPHFLEVWKITHFGLMMRVRNSVSRQRFLTTNFALPGHIIVRYYLGEMGLKVKPFHSNQSLGKEGERLASEYLFKQGFQIIASNFRTRHGEIDLIAKKKGEYYFVEVKRRQNDSFGSALEALPFYRVERLKKMANVYATRYRLHSVPLHLSLLGIDGLEPHCAITFLENLTGD